MGFFSELHYMNVIRSSISSDTQHSMNTFLSVMHTVDMEGDHPVINTVNHLSVQHLLPILSIIPRDTYCPWFPSI